jgi:thiol-disulfide isomerase/thioredoxin
MGRVVPQMIALALALLSGCRNEAPGGERGPNAQPAPMRVVGHEPGSTASTGAPTTASTAPSTAAPEGEAPGDDVIPWPGPIQWQTWEQGLAQAQAEGKPICLVVYADWCPHCRELAPVFSQPAIATLAQRLVMVRQDSDERPAWLTQRFGRLGAYVPRVLFLRPDGSLIEEIVSGHPRYPYFYSPLVSDRLLANMHAAIAGG